MPLWLILTFFGHIFRGKLSILQNFDPILANRFAVGPIFIIVNGQILISLITLIARGMCVAKLAYLVAISNRGYRVLTQVQTN